MVPVGTVEMVEGSEEGKGEARQRRYMVTLSEAARTRGKNEGRAS